MTHLTPRSIAAHELLGQTEWIRRLAGSLVGDSARADDLTQETLVAALRGAPSDAEHRRAWLARVVHNLARLDQRRAIRRSDRESEAARIDRAEDHAALVEEADAHRALVEHVMALDEPHRGMLLQRYFRGWTPAEIAARKGSTTAAVSSQLTRAHAALRERLERTGGRDHWHVALAPLVTPVGGASDVAGAVAPSGWFLASASTKLVAIAAVAVCGVLIVAYGDRGPGPDVAPPTDDLTAQREDSTLDEEEVRIAAPGEGLSSRSAPEPRPPAEAETTTLRATLMDMAGDPLPVAHVRIDAPNGERWRSRASVEGGDMEFDRLPTETSLAAFAVVDHVPAREPIERFVLEPGEIAERSWRVRARTTVRGRTVLASGVGAPGQIAQLIRRRAGTRPRFDVAAGEGDPFARTDEHGDFVLPDVPAGRYWIGASIDYPLHERFELTTNADGEEIRLRRSKPKNPGCELYVPLDIAPGSSELEVTIPIYNELFITGRVLGPQSEPIRDIVVEAIRESTDRELWGRTGRSGTFRIGPVAPGRYSLHCRSNDADVAHAKDWVVDQDVIVQAGDEDVEVRVLRGARVRGRVLTDPTTVEGVLSLIPDRSAMNGGRRVDVSLPSGRGGAFELRALAPGTYTLTYRCFGEPLAAVREGLVLARSEFVDDLEVRAEPAVRVVLRNPGERWAQVEVRVDDVLFEMAGVEPDKAHEVSVPPGRIELRGLETDVAPSEGPIEAQAGERLEFEVRGR